MNVQKKKEIKNVTEIWRGHRKQPGDGAGERPGLAQAVVRLKQRELWEKIQTNLPDICIGLSWPLGH